MPVVVVPGDVWQGRRRKGAGLLETGVARDLTFLMPSDAPLPIYKMDRWFSLFIPEDARQVVGSVCYTDGLRKESGMSLRVYIGRESVTKTISLGAHTTLLYLC